MTPQRVANLPWRTIGDRCVVIHPARGEVHELDEVGTFLWRETDGQQTLNQICARMTETFEVSHAEATADAEEFYARLESLGLLTCRS